MNQKCEHEWNGQAPAGAWIERWYGSGGKDGYEGWSIVNKDGRDLVAYFGRNVEPGAVTEIVMAHNAAIAATTAQAAPAAGAVAGPVNAVAYLDIGTGGYLDIGTDLTDEALLRLPKGRHALVIAGTYGVDGYAAAPTPAAQADSQPAPVAAHVVADALADSQYLAGVSAGWNAANADDPNAALQKLHESRAGYLKPLSAARAPADSVQEDAARATLFTTPAQRREMAGDGKPCNNDHDPDCRWPDCICRHREAQFGAARKQGGKHDNH